MIRAIWGTKGANVAERRKAEQVIKAKSVYEAPAIFT